MPRYFFDMQDGEFHRDDDGTVCADLEAARMEVMLTLPEIARSALPSGGDDQAFSISVRDESDAVVYTATLSFAGLKLEPEAKNASLDW